MALNVDVMRGVEATPDAEGGSQPPDGSVTPDVGTVGAADDAGDGARSDDDDSDDDDYSDVPFNKHPRFKALTRKLGKQAKQLAKYRPLAERVKDVDVDGLMVKARTADELSDILSKNPGLRKQFMEAMSNPAPSGPAGEPEFDPSKLPFDVTDESGKFFATFYKEFLDIKKQNAQLLEHVRGEKVNKAAQGRAAEGHAWKSAVKAAEAQLPEHYREMFNDAVYGAMKEARERKVTVNPQHVIDHYLKGLGLNKGATAKASGAAAQRIAEHNKGLPRQPQHAGVPASTKGDKKESVADVSRRLKAQFAR